MGRLLSFLITLLTSAALANNNPVGINVSGRIVDDATNSALAGTVDFRVMVMSPGNCVLYTEEFNNYTISSTGTFTFTLGTGATASNAYGGTGVAAQTSAQLKKIFSNSAGAVTALADGFASGASGTDGVSCAGLSYTPAAGDYRKVRIEFDAGSGYAAILPFHVIRAVPYAMIADEAVNAIQLNGAPASDYAKMTDLPDLATGVPAAETDPSVKAFAKADITGVSGTSCPAGYVLTLDNNVVKCVVDAGAATIPVATDSVLGGVMVPGASDIAIDGSGNLTLKALATSKITGLDTALAGAVKYTDMPGASCAAGEALVWLTPSNTFSCFALTLDTAHVTGLDAALAAKLPLAGGTMTGALNMGSQDVLATGHITMANQKTITVGKYDQTQENTLAGTLNGSNEGATWYNSAMKALRFWDGTARQTVVSTSAACADGQILKWNDTTKVWACSADAGAGGADASSIRSTTVDATAPTTTGQVLRYNSGTTSWEPSMIQAADLPTGIARSKVAAGTANHVLINDGTGALSSEAQLNVTRGGTGQSTYTDGQILIGKTDGTLAKSTVTAGTGITVTNGDGTITIAATATAPGDAGYGGANKGVVAFNTDAATSGVSVAAGVATVNTGTAANQIVKLDGTARLPAVDGSQLTGITAVVDQITSAAGKYFGYKPNNVECADGGVLVWNATADQWECGTQSTPGDASYAAKGVVQFDTDAATSGVTVAAGVATVNTGTGANQIVKLDGTSKLPAVDGSALTNITTTVDKITSAAGKYFTYMPNNVACSDQQVLKWDNTNSRWSCAADAGAGGADASSIRGVTVAAGAATPAAGSFLMYNNATSSWEATLFTDCVGAGKSINYNATLNTWNCVDVAIDRSKINVAAGAANHVVINDGTGAISSEAQLAVSRGGTGQSTYTDGQILIGKTDGTLAKSTVTAGTGITVTNGDGTITIAATATAPGDAGYGGANKGVVAFNTDAATSGVSVAAGVATVNTGTGANQIVKLDGSSKLPAVDGSALTNLDVGNIVSAVGKYFTYAPNGAACTNGEILKKTANGWECAADATGTSPGDSSYAAKGIVQFDTDAATSGMTVATGVASVNTGTGANQIVKLDGTSKLPAVDGSALTNITTTVDKITSAAGKYFTYMPNNVACSDQQVLKWDNGNSRWSCAADAGAGGADASSIRGVTVAAGAATPAAGSFLMYNNATTSWEATLFTDCVGAGKSINYNATLNTWNCVDVAIDRSKINVAAGAANHVVINDGTGAISSEAQLAVSRGGTGQSSYTDGQLLIGNSTGNTLSKATLTAGTGVTITNGNGSITIAADPTGSIVDGSIVDADVNAAAAIARTKLAAGTASRAVVTDGSGFMTESATTSTEIGYVSGVTSAIQGQIDAKVAKAGDTMTGNLVMNAAKEVRFADSDSDHFIGLRSPATVAADVTFTLPTTDGTANYVLKTDGSGNLGWVALPAGAVDASYAAKGIVQFNTDADTSGVTVAAGVATLNTGTTANKIVKLDGTAKLPAVDGSALTNITTTVDKITSAAGKYFTYMPNNVACSDQQVLKWDNGNSRWICAADAGAGGADASSIRGVTVAAGAATPAAGSFLMYNNATTSWEATLFTDCVGAGKSINYNATLNTWNCVDVAIDRSKINVAAGAANHVVINDGTGAISSEAQLAVSRGGTGQSSYTDGQLLIGNSTGNTLSKATLTAGSGVTITNGNGSITIAADPTGSIVDGSIVDADVNASAAIARTKLANGTANRIVVNDGSGVMADAAAITASRALISDANGIPTHSTVTGAELAYVSGVTSAIQGQIDGKVAKAGDTMTGNLVMNAAKEVRFADSDSDHFVGLKSPATVGADVTFTLPATDGTANYVLKTDGSGNLGWVALPAGTVDSSYAAKGVVQFLTDADTSGITVASGVANVNTGTTANKIVKLDASAKLPAVDGSALTNLGIENLANAAGKYFKYMPNGTECADGEILKWVAATDRWVCGTAADLGAITSVVAGTGLDVNTVAGAATVSVEAELGALNGLSTTGYVQRTGAATYSTTAGNTLNSNSTVVTRDGSGVSGFAGVLLNNAAMNVTQVAPGAGTSYQVTWPAAAPTVNGQVLTATTGGVMTWETPATGSGDFLANGTVAMTGALRNIAGTAALPGMTFVGDTNTGISAATADTMVLSTAGTQRVVVDSTGKVGIGTGTPTSHLHVNADDAVARIENTSTSAFSSARLYMTNKEVSATGGIFYFMSEKISAGAATGETDFQFRVTDAGGNRTDLMYVPSDTRDIIFNGSKTAGGVYGNVLVSNGSVGIGTATPGAPLDVKGAIRMSGATSGYTGFQPAANAGSTVWTLPAADGTANYVLKTDGSGNLGWVALPSAAADSSYAAKGVVQFLTDADTSGITVASGVANVNTGTTANKIVKLDASAKLPAVDGSALTNLSIENLLNAAGKYFKYKPNNVECANNDNLKWDAAADTWICSTPAGSGDAGYGSGNKGLVAFNTDAATSGISVASGVATVNFGTGANQIVKLDGTSKLPAVDGSALTNLSAANISAGTLPVARGGTGQTSFTGYGILVADSAGTALSGKTCAVGEHLTWTVSGWICGKDFYQTGSATSANYIRATGAAASSSPIIDAAGTDANIDLKLLAKGTGTINLQSKYLERSPAAVSGAQTIPADTNFHSNTLATGGGATAITLPDPTGYASNTAFSLTVKIKQPSSGADGTITWTTAGAGVTIKWDSGTAPAPATGNNKEAIYQFLYMKNENIWYAMQVWKEN